MKTYFIQLDFDPGDGQKKSVAIPINRITDIEEDGAGCKIHTPGRFYRVYHTVAATVLKIAQAQKE